MEDIYDMIVIGAGWYGLAAAKAYIELHPDQRIIVLEGAGSIGGTWAHDRLYPGLASNNVIGSLEYPEFPMSQSIYGVAPKSHIPGNIVHRYLTDYAKKFGILARTQFNTKIMAIEPSQDGNWILSGISNKEQQFFQSRKLILATGLTSEPNLPRYIGREIFDSPFFHAKDFCLNSETVGATKNAVIIGGAKSAFDVAYAYAEGGAEVDLVIRQTGNGPAWICPAYVTPFKRLLEELLHIRFFTWFSPCAWGGEDGFSGARNFLHRTTIGRWIVDKFWKILFADIGGLVRYESNSNLKKLKPWNSALWTGSGLGIDNYPTSFFDSVRAGKIRVHIADVAKLERKAVHLTSGETLKADLIVCSTGWKKNPPLKFVNFGAEDIGLDLSPSEKRKQNKMADDEILSMFPILRAQPVLKYTPEEADPMRLHRFIVPPTRFWDENIAFAGMVSSTNTSVSASVQGLWISAFLDGKLERKPKDQGVLTKETMLHTQWGKWRYPCGYGGRFPDLAFDGLAYIDLLLNDLGLTNHRKKSRLAEIFEPYKPRDYAGLMEEWQTLQGKNKGN